MSYNDYDENYIDYDNNNDINVNSNTTKQTKQTKFKIIKYNLIVDGKFIKKKIIEIYSTGSTGNLIKNAQTGVKTNVRVGTKEEDMYFKVSDCSSNGNIPTNYYYDSPEEYETHFCCILEQNIKDRWRVKQTMYCVPETEPLNDILIS